MGQIWTLAPRYPHTQNCSDSTKVMKTGRIEAFLQRVFESLKSAASRAGAGYWRLVELSEKKRPMVVKILVLIVAIASIIPILSGVMMLTGGVAYEGYFMQELLSQIVPTYTVLIGVIGLVAAWGLWIGRSWAWTLALIVFIIGCESQRHSGQYGIIWNVVLADAWRKRRRKA